MINEEKSDLVPSQTANYLGMTIDTGTTKIFPSHARVEKFLSVAEMFCTMFAPPSQLAGGFGSPGFAGETSSSQSTLNALSAVAFEDALVPRVGSSLPPGAFFLGGERGFVLVDGEGPVTCSRGFDLGHPLQIYTCTLDVSRSGWGVPPRLSSVRGMVGAG